MMADTIAIAATKDILESNISIGRKAAKIVSQMEWHPGLGDKETWEAIILLILARVSPAEQADPKPVAK